MPFIPLELGLANAISRRRSQAPMYLAPNNQESMFGNLFKNLEGAQAAEQPAKPNVSADEIKKLMEEIAALKKQIAEKPKETQQTVDAKPIPQAMQDLYAVINGKGKPTTPQPTIGAKPISDAMQDLTNVIGGKGQGTPVNGLGLSVDPSDVESQVKWFNYTPTEAERAGVITGGAVMARWRYAKRVADLMSKHNLTVMDAEEMLRKQENQRNKEMRNALDSGNFEDLLKIQKNGSEQPSSEYVSNPNSVDPKARQLDRGNPSGTLPLAIPEWQKGIIDTIIAQYPESQRERMYAFAQELMANG